jgi:hypothetical protein
MPRMDMSMESSVQGASDDDACGHAHHVRGTWSVYATRDRSHFGGSKVFQSDIISLSHLSLTVNGQRSTVLCT